MPVDRLAAPSASSGHVERRRKSIHLLIHFPILYLWLQSAAAFFGYRRRAETAEDVRIPGKLQFQAEFVALLSEAA